MKSKQKNLEKLIKIVLTIFIVVASFFVIKYLPLERVRAIIKSGGAFAPLIYILLFSILPIFFFPVPILALAGGLAFGVWKGSFYTIIGASINCILMYLIAKYIGKEQVDRYLDKHLSEDVKKRIASKETDIGFYLFVLRLTPIIPYNLINYMSGLLDIELKKYIIISILGIMPGTAVYLNMGDKAINYKSKEFVLSVVFMVVLVILANLLTKYLKKKGKL
ncbi:TVP38/TMEM64 family protein [Mediannikoviicoccus vaginalis]|uniref:TVP38/TMEM64 family protein n=1 Tax=Mediannikoviicoccus vaginalis TaxID=2899727 RepID=UPI001F337297|nr:TVP38/TMEM64 family protein [Mediannikoviicoccus vaginalis]